LVRRPLSGVPDRARHGQFSAGSPGFAEGD